MDQGVANAVLAIAAISQGFFTFVIVCVTAYYARLTQKLVQMQIEPELELEVPLDVLDEKASGKGEISNHSSCGIKDLVMRVSVPSYETLQPRGAMLQCRDVQTWPKGVKPNQNVVIDCKEYFRHAQEALDISDLSSELKSLHSNIIFDISCRRKADGKAFYFTEQYGVLVDEKGQKKVIRREQQRAATDKRYILT